MKVGIDLSSTNTGLVILSDDNKLIWHGNFQLWDNDRFVIASKVNEMIDYIELKNPFHKFFMTGIELADFKNANITNRFHFLTGIIISELARRNFVSAIYDKDNKLVMQLVKLFNSNEWQRFLLEKYKPNIQAIKKIVGYKKYDDGDGYIDEVPIYKEYYEIKLNYNILPNINFAPKLTIVKDERTLRKALSRIFTKQNCDEYKENWTEDECDAYCIAYFLEKLRDRTQMHQEVKAKKIQAKKSKLAEKNEQIRKLKKSAKLSEIIARYDKCIASGKKLTKSQINAQERAIKELEELKNE